MRFGIYTYKSTVHQKIVAQAGIDRLQRKQQIQIQIQNTHP